MTRFVRAACALALLVSAGAARPALAQEPSLNVTTLPQGTALLPVPSYSLARPDLGMAEQVGVSLAPKIVERRPTSSAWKGTLAALDVMTISTQLADYDSTMKVLKVGGVEANPLMSGLVNNKHAFLGAKLGIAAGLVYATHNLARHNKVAAIIASVAANSAYAYISQRNYRLARSASGTGR